MADSEDSRMCPSCGSSDIARILYGEPAFSEELRRDLESGRIVLGGCVIVKGQIPKYRCNDCGHEFGVVAFGF